MHCCAWLWPRAWPGGRSDPRPGGQGRRRRVAVACFAVQTFSRQPGAVVHGGRDGQTVGRRVARCRVDCEHRHRRARTRRRAQERRRPDAADPRRHGRLAGAGGNRPAARQHQADGRRPGQHGLHHARLRARRAHDELRRHGAAAGPTARPVERHAGDDRPAGGGARRRRARDARGRVVQAVPSAGLLHRAARGVRPASRDDRLQFRLRVRQRRFGGHHRARAGRPRLAAAGVEGSDSARVADRHCAADDRQPRGASARAGRGHRRVDPRRHKAQHHSQRGEVATDHPFVHRRGPRPNPCGDQAHQPGHRAGRRRGEGSAADRDGEGRVHAVGLQ